MEKKYTIKDFVEEYLETNVLDRGNLIDSVIIRTYAPVLEKKLILQTLISSSTKKGVYGTEFIDMLLSKVHITLAIITLYTSLKITNTDIENNSIFTDYDLLIQNDIMNQICKVIGDTEIQELMFVNETLIENYEKEYNSLEGFFGRQIVRFTTIVAEKINDGLIQLSEVLKDDKRMTKIVKQINSSVNYFKK